MRTAEREAMPHWLSEDRKPWERQPGESVKAYGAFLEYRNTPTHSRSARAVARKLAKSWSLVSRWSSAWRWSYRADQWDNQQEQARHERLRVQRDAVREEALRVARSLLVGVMARVTGDRAYRMGDVLMRVEALDPNMLSARDVASLAKAAVAIEGMVTDLPKKHFGMASADLDGGAIIADGTEEQYVGAINEALRREGRLPESAP